MNINAREIYITHAKRTAVGTLLGGLSSISAAQLGSSVIKSILQSSELDPANIDEVILGQVITGGAGQNPARQALMGAGIPQEVPGFTVNKVCGSGLKAVCLAAQAIAFGTADIIIAGGQENMSLGNHGTYIRKGNKLGDIKMIDQMQYDGLVDYFSNVAMGITAENIARQFNVTRDAQDEFALSSHQKAAAARSAGKFKDEILPIEIMIKKQAVMFDQDEGIRPDTNLEALSGLKPAFMDKGTVTAGNASGINDGAACLMVVSGAALKKHNLEPLVRIRSFGTAGAPPSIMGVASVPASRQALKRAGWNIEDLDIIEVNEAFAAQTIYVNREMKWDVGKVNMNGGAIALGHPIGASGARVLTTLIHQMKNNHLEKGLVTLCIGGGMGIAMCLEGM